MKTDKDKMLQATQIDVVANLTETLPITKLGQTDIAGVSARALHRALQVGKDFSTWFKDKTAELELIEGDDYERERNLSNSVFSLSAAKSITVASLYMAVKERKQKRKEVLRHLVACEKRQAAYSSSVPAQKKLFDKDASRARVNAILWDAMEKSRSSDKIIIRSSPMSDWALALNRRLATVKFEDGKYIQMYTYVADADSYLKAIYGSNPKFAMHAGLLNFLCRMCDGSLSADAVYTLDSVIWLIECAINRGTADSNMIAFYNNVMDMESQQSQTE